jgi:ABC-type multidrug transport system ATPase subunit
VSSIVRLEDAVVVTGGFPVLSGATFCVSEPSVTVLVGANGAGKTSLLRLLGGLCALTSGTGAVLGIDLAHGDRRQLRRRVGWLGHEGAFYDDLTVRDNLVFAARALGRPVDEIDPALARVGLSTRAATLARLLSAGQRRRLALAADGRTFLDALLRDVVATGVSAVVTSHDPLGDADLNARTFRLAGGRVVEGPR